MALLANRPRPLSGIQTFCVAIGCAMRHVDIEHHSSLKRMCGRFTYKLTWEELVRLYRLSLDQPPRNTQASYNVCPTDTIDTIVFHDGKRELVPMRWGLVPRWWSKTIKDAKMATFNARAETVETKPFFRDAFKRTRCLIPVSGYYEWQDTPGGKQPWYFTARDGSPAPPGTASWRNSLGSRALAASLNVASAFSPTSSTMPASPPSPR